MLHFLLLGLAMAAYSAWDTGRGGAGGRHEVVVDARTVAYLGEQFALTWRRPPDAQELKRLVDEHVKEEIASREALAMGLDRDDTVIRRRLRQKLEFLLVEEAAAAAPTDDALRAWMARHPDRFRREPRVAFRQVYLRPGARGAALPEDARRLLARLRQAGPEAAIDTLGDATMLPGEQPAVALEQVAKAFGEAFAESLATLPVGEWSGPVESSFGLHLVLVRERVPGAPAELDAVRPLVLREVLAERQKAALQEVYDRLLTKYSVIVQAPPAASATARGGPAGASAPAGPGSAP
ncbi:MAG: peptidyl-prolyl cis-trans isomerase [Burkholderiales bacterium]|jgi:parvulin-like peptidyl-prolyl isomerase